MKVKLRANPRSSNGKRDLLTLRPGRPPPSAAWRDSTAVLISKSAVPKGRVLGKKADGIRVFLIEDNRMVREGLVAMLGAEGLKVVATARSSREALRQVGRLKPQLILLDSALRDRDSLRMVTAVKALSPRIKIIVMHLLPAHEDVVDLVRAGVSGFIMKDASAAEYVATIRSVANGESVLPRRMTTTLFSHVAEQVVARKKRDMKAATRMTSREREVTALIARGLGNKEIAERLDIAAHTVKSHVHNILEKLALHTRLEVAAYAHANGKRRTTQ